jgi:WD40 repeat protein
VSEARVFRVFISSTFADMQAEREALQAFVFPRLRELCASYGARFHAVDLRWGISADAAEDQQTLDICLREVERCQRLTPRPNFLILLGERYGWRPLPPTIPLDEFSTIEAALDLDDRVRLQEWYWRDDNAVPPMFVLRARTAGDADSAWPEIEQALASALSRAVARLGWSRAQAAPYVSSATEREIECGVFSSAGADEHVAAVSRVIGGIPRDAGAGTFLDADRGRTSDAEAAALLETLRGRLRERLGPRMVEVSATWTDDGPSPGHIGTLAPSMDACLPLLDATYKPATVCEAVWRALGRVIRAECIHVRKRSSLNLERDAHLAFRDGRAAIFIGRDAELASIAAYIAGNEPGPLAVLGGFGSGKSALIARAIVDAVARTQTIAVQQSAAVESDATPHVVFRFVGATAASTSSVQLLRSLGTELQDAVAEPPATLKALTEWFPETLARASATRPLVVFIDALDQLAANDGARTLAWLPYTLPPGVRVVVSAAPGDVTRVLEGRQQESAIVRVGALTPASGGELLNTWARGAGRALLPQQRQTVLASFARCGQPLHLRLAFEEARRWRSFDQPTDLAGDVPGLVRQLLARLSREANHGPVLVRQSLGYLSASRNGLTEDEILDVLSADPAVMDSVRRRSPDSPVTNRLPPVIWSRLYDELDPYLTQRDADGTSTLGFFHRQLAEVVTADFLAPSGRSDRHDHLADYFARQPRAVGSSATVNLRRLSELPWHLAGAARWDRFVNVVADFAFLDARIRTATPQAVIDDLDLVLELEAARKALPAPAFEALTTLRAFVRLSANILARDPSQLGGQLMGRVDPRGNPLLAKIVEEAAAREAKPSLQPEGPTLAAPDGDLIATLAGHTKAALAIGITPDGTLAVSGSADGTIRVWSLDEQVERFVIPVGHGEVRSLAVTPDGKFVVSGSEDGSIDVWDVASGALVRRWQAQGCWRALMMTPDGTRILSGSNGPAVLWDFASGEQLATIEPSGTATIAVAISGDARLAVIGGVYDYVSLWDLEANRTLVQWPQGRDSWVSSVAITADGRYAFSADWDGRTKVWDVEARTQIGQFAGHGYKRVTAIAVTPDGSKVVTADDHGRIVLHRGVGWPGVSDRFDDVVMKVVTTTGHRVQQLALTPDGRRAITSGMDGTVRVWDLTVDHAQASAEVFPGGYSDDDAGFTAWWRRVFVTEVHAAAAPAFDVRRFPTVASDGWSVVPRRFQRPRRWDDDDAMPPIAFTVVDGTGTDRSPEIEIGTCVTPPALSLDGRLVAFVDFGRRVSVWEVATGVRQHVFSFEAEPSQVAGAGLGRPIATAPSDRHTAQLLAKAVVALSPDSRTLLCAIDTAIAVWDLASGNRLTSPVGPFEWDGPQDGLPPERSPRFTSDGAYILAMRTSGFFGVWRTGQSDHVAQWSVPKNCKAGFASGGRSAWWFAGDRLRHWSIAPQADRNSRGFPAKEPFGRPRIFPVPIPSVRLSADGDFAIGVDADRLKIWRLPRRTPVIEMAASGVRSVAIALTAGGRGEAGLRGLMARGGPRLEVFDLPSLAFVAAFDADAPFEECSFASMSAITATTADGRRHRLRLLR